MNKVELPDGIQVKPGVMPMVAMLTNPLSSANIQRLPEIREVINRSHNVIHFEMNTIADIDEGLSLFARAQPSMLIINGGDGTVGMVLQALLYRNPFKIIPPIAILPCGKTNMTGADLGLTGSPIKILKKLLKLVHTKDSSAKIVTRHMIEVDLGDGKCARVGTFFGAAGIVQSVLWCRNNIYPKKWPAFFAHFVTFGVLLGASANLVLKDQIAVGEDMDIYIQGGGRLTGQYSALSCTTLDDLILGARPYASFGSGGLRFGCVSHGGSNMLRAIMGLITGRFSKGNVKGVQVRRSNMIRIKTAGHVMLDGEILKVMSNIPIILKGDKNLSFVSLIK